jgi:hypothetical protein
MPDGDELIMDYYVPKRRIPVTLWAEDRQSVAGQIFLDLDSRGGQHPTIVEMLNQTSPFLPVAIGPEGRVRLFNRSCLMRVSPGRQVIQSDIFSRGFQPWREERAEIAMRDGARLSGQVWMPLERETERLSDYLNRLGPRFFVLLTPAGIHLLNGAGVAEVELAESLGAPLASGSEH